MTKEFALVGFSVNSEIYVGYDARMALEKAPLESIKFGIGGTSLNVALAINNFGGKSKLIALTGENNDDSTHILKRMLKKIKIPHTNIPVLDKSHIALIPDDKIQTKKVFGAKGKINSQKMDFVFGQIEKETGKWRIATGARTEEVEFVKFLFNKHFGYRSLNPRMELVKNKRAFYEVLHSTDLLICNLAEYEAIQVTSPSEIHQYGPSLVIITDGENGGMFSKNGEQAKTFSAYTEFSQKSVNLYPTGIGDWFHGSFVGQCMSINKPFVDLNLNEISTFIDISTKVAGKKITMEGASNGPSVDNLF